MNCAETLTTGPVEVLKVTNKPEKSSIKDNVEYDGENYRGCEVLFSNSLIIHQF